MTLLRREGKQGILSYIELKLHPTTKESRTGECMKRNEFRLKRKRPIWIKNDGILWKTQSTCRNKKDIDFEVDNSA